MILPEHHAIFVEGGKESTIKFVHSVLAKKGIRIDSNPDVIFLNYDSLGIDEVKELSAISLNAPIAEKKKTIILSFAGITLQAQNALLKLFEDPNPQSEFLIASKNANVLLPTLRSRLYVMSLDGNQSDHAEAREFLSLPVGARMKKAESMLQKYKEDGDKSAIRELLIGIHRELEKDPKEKAEALCASAHSLSYIDSTSASMKLLLESVALRA